MNIRGITIAVGPWYARTLELCLASNMRHLAECLVVTAPGDEAVRSVVAAVPGARVFETDAFTRPDIHGTVPRFNKGLAMNEGLRDLGLDGWIWIFDSDVRFPDFVPIAQLSVGKLHGCTRRVLEDPERWRPNLDWNDCPRMRDAAPIGFTQIFSCDDPVVRANARQLYDVSFPHCGGGDARFLYLWPRSRWNVLPFDVLHFGRVDVNWAGCDQDGKDMMARYVHENGWRRAMVNHSVESAARGAPMPPRLSYPGYEQTFFDIPFERRAAAQRRSS